MAQVKRATGMVTEGNKGIIRPDTQVVKTQKLKKSKIKGLKIRWKPPTP